MVQTISADKLTLYELEQQFGVQQVHERQFFPEWHSDLPALTPQEEQRLERVQATYANLSRRSVLENTIKMAIVSPLLDLAGFFLPPFYVTTEAEVHIRAQENDLRVRGKIDILVLKDQFWVLIVESKRAEFSVKVGIPQTLAQPHRKAGRGKGKFCFLSWEENIPHYAPPQINLERGRTRSKI